MDQGCPDSVIDLCEEEGEREISRKERQNVKKRRLEQKPKVNSVSTNVTLLATIEDKQNRTKHCVDHPSWRLCSTLRELLGYDGTSRNVGVGQPQFLVLCNYIVDFEFLLNEVPELLSIPSVVAFYGSAESSGNIWKMAAAKSDDVDLVCLRPSDHVDSPTNPLGQRIPFGVHHSKIFLVGLGNGSLRVVIHTANIRHSDINLKAQAAFAQDFLPKVHRAATTQSEFEESLVSYFASYRYAKRRSWFPGSKKGGATCRQTLEECLRAFDFSTAKAVLIPSTPGYHRLDVPLHNRCGHLKLREAISLHCPCPLNEKDMLPVVLQFSSIGSLSEKYMLELLESMDIICATRGRLERPTKSELPLKQRAKIVFPTVEEIRTSVEGYRGGGSVPSTSRNIEKPFLRSLFHRWSSHSSVNPVQKSSNVPHIKTYFQLQRHRNEDEVVIASLAWFVLSSHNLSKAAWGEVQNSPKFGGRRLFMRHWELGVFLAPSLLNCTHLVAVSDELKVRSGTIASVPLPYQLFPQPYGREDQPWAVDKTYPQADRLGHRSFASSLPTTVGTRGM